jgi:pseudouridine synthase
MHKPSFKWAFLLSGVLTDLAGIIRKLYNQGGYCVRARRGGRILPERLHKVLAGAGVGSRRACEELIRDDRVRVDGEPAGIGMLVDPERQDIRVDGKKVSLAGQLYYFLVYKPKGYVSTASDPQGRPKVTDLVALPGVRLYPVGRLDRQTSGLLILTNDGELTFLLTHPRHDVWKTYQAQVTGVPGAVEIARLQQGVLLPEGKTAPARVKIVRALPGGALLEIGLREGKKRQVRQMCEAVGHPVIELRRVSLAFLTLEGLRPGQHRQLTPDEVRTLKEIAVGGERTTAVSKRGRATQSLKEISVRSQD